MLLKRVSGSHRALAVLLSGIGLLLAGARATTQPPGPDILNLRLPSGIENTEYRHVLVSQNATQPVWSITAGAFSASGGDYVGLAGTSCEGLTLNSATGAFSGTTIRAGACGPFIVRLEDLSSGSTVTREFTIGVVPNIGIVTNGTSTVSILDARTASPLGSAFVARSVDSVAFSPDGAFAYFTSRASTIDAPLGSIVVWDTTTRAIVRVVEVTQPIAVAATPNGHFIVVTGFGGPMGSSAHMTVIETTSFTAVTSVTLNSEPTALAVSLDSHFAYVGTFDGVVSRVDLLSGVKSTMLVGSRPRALGVDPRGQFIYVASSAGITLVSPFTFVALGPIQLDRNGALPVEARELSISPDGRFAYVTTDDGYLHLVDLLQQVDAGRIPIFSGSSPTSLALSHDGEKVFLGVRDQSRVFVATSSMGSIASIPVAGTPTDVALTPNGLLRVVTRELPTARVGAFYGGDLTAAGGTGPYTFSADQSELPPGLTVGASGHVSGVPSVPGSFDFTVTVRDSSSPSQDAPRTFTVVVEPTTPPIAVFVARPDVATAGMSVEFDATDSYDPDAADHISQYEWDFDGDGTFDAAGPSSIVSHAFSAPDNWTVVLRVTDSFGASSTAAITVPVVPNDPPTADIQVDSFQMLAGASATFSGVGSWDPNSGSGDVIARYVWDFGDGTTAEGASVDHAFAIAGQYTVRLTVTDSGGLTAFTTVTIVVVPNHAPTAAFSVTPNPGRPGFPVLLDASASSDPDGAFGDRIVLYEWNLDADPDGTFEIVSTDATHYHTFATIGSYPIELRVTDSAGAQATSALTLAVEFGIVNQALRSAMVDRQYEQQLAAGGATGISSWQILSSALFVEVTPGTFTGAIGTACEGLTLDTQGRFTGAPHQAGVCGPFVVRVTDAGGASAEQEFRIRVLPAVVYVANNGAASVSVVDTITRTQVTQIPVDGQPAGVAMSPGGDRAYVTLPGTISSSDGLPHPGGNRVAIIDTSTNSVLQTVTVGQGPTKVAVSPDGRLAYVVNTLDGTVSIIDAVTLAVTDTVSVGWQPSGIAITPDGRRVLVSMADFVYVFDANLNFVNAEYLGGGGGRRATDVTIDPRTQSSGHTIYVTVTDQAGSALNSYELVGNSLLLRSTLTLPAEALPIDLEISPDGRWAYAASELGVAVVDLLNARLVEPVFGGSVSGTAFDPDGGSAFVTQTPEALVVVDTATHASAAQIVVGENPAGVAFMPLPALHIATRSPRKALVDSLYFASITAAGGVWPYRFSLTAGSLPPGIVMDDFGALSGVPTANGHYEFQVTAVDADVPPQSATRQLVIDVNTNLPPTAVLHANPNPAATGEFVQFDGSLSTDPNTDSGDQIVRHEWDFDDDGISDAEGQFVYYAFQTNGTHHVTLRVTDSGDLQSSASASIVTSTAPLAQFSFVPVEPWAGQLVSFDASASQEFDVADSIVRYEWDFDGTGFTVSGTTPFASHVFSLGGGYLVTLRVTDTFGVSGTTSTYVNVRENLPPSVSVFAFPNPVIATGNVMFFADVIEPEGQQVTFQWDFQSDGIVDSTQQSPEFSYGSAGTFTAALTVTDEFGALSTATVDVEVVANRAPSAAFTTQPALPVAGMPVLFEAAGSSDPDEFMGGGIVLYSWTFGDGATGDGFAIEHAYSLPGTYPAQLTVTDAGGLTSTTARSIVVSENHAPVAAFTATPSPAVAGVPVMFDASASSDPDAAAGDAVVRYEWDLDGNGTFEVDSTEPATTTMFAATGSHAVTLRVTDRGGMAGVHTQPLDVVFGLINQKLRNALVGAAYQQQFAAGGATGPVVFSVTSGPFTGSGPYDGASGTPCSGLQLTALGRLSGTPTQVGLCGPFTVTATDGLATGAHTYTVRVLPAYAYVANNGSSTVSVIDPVTNTEVDVIPVPGRPGGIAVRPDGERVYVSITGDISQFQTLQLTNPGHTVVVINTTTQAVVATIPVGIAPTGIAASPDGSLVYVTNSLNQSISVIDTQTNAVVDTIVSNGLPVRLAVSPDGARLYVADVFGHIRIYDTATRTEEATINLQNNQVSAVALSPDGRHLLAGALNNPAIRVFDTATLAQVEGATLSGGPVSAFGVTPDGRLAYLAANPVGVVDLNGLFLQASVPPTGTPFEVALTPDGGRALVSDFGSLVQLIDTADQTEAGTIVVGQRPAGIGVLPNPSLHITTSTLPPGATGIPYDFAVAAAGGQPGYVFTIDPATLPPGLSSDATGRVTGTPSQTGVYQLAVAVADADLPQQTVTALVSLTIGANHAPVAQFTVTPESAVVDELVRFDGQDSFDPDRAAADRIVAFAWDLDNDGVFNDGIGSVAERTFAATGQYVIRLQVTDRAGLTHVAERLVSVNAFHLGDFAAQPNPVVAGVPVSFDALGKGENSFALRYDWDFTSDGTFDVLNQPVAQYAFGAAGTYQVTLRGTDDTDQSALITRPITVIANAPPVAAFTATPSTTLTGLPVLFDATASSDADPEAGGGVVSYTWTFGDTTTGDGFVIEHVYAAPGTYAAQLTVTDTSGVSATTTQSIVVTENHAPHAAFTATPSPAVVGAPVIFDASGSSDPDAAAGDAIVRYEWDLDGDDTFEVDGTSIATTTFATTGDHTASLRVTDHNGATDVQTQTLEVVFGLINQTLRNALVGVVYQQQLAAGGATGPVTFSITSGPFTGSGPYAGVPGTSCDGLQMTSSGHLAGTPTQVGVCGPFTATASDGFANAAHTYAVRVLPSVAYVANNASSTVSVIDPATQVEVAVIQVPGQPGGVAVRPDGERVYVTLPGDVSNLFSVFTQGGSNAVAVIDPTVDPPTVTTIPVGSRPTGMVASPDGRWVYVANTASHTISVIDAQSQTVSDTFPAGLFPIGLALSPDGQRLYVARPARSDIGVFDAASHVEQTQIQLNNFLVVSVAASPDGRYLFAGAGSNSAIRVIDTATLSEVPTTGVTSSAARGISFTPDGRFVYSATNPVGVIDVNQLALQSSVAIGGSGFASAVTPDGRYALITDFTSHVQLVDVATQTDAGTIAVGLKPAGVGVVPQPALHIATTALPGGLIGLPYDFAVVAAGGRPGYTFTIDPATLPPGLISDATGRVMGVPTAAGIYQLAVTVTDTDVPPQTVTGIVTLAVSANTPPVAQFTVSPEPAAVDDFVFFDGQSSFDPDGAAGDRIVAFAWDLDNDGAFEDSNEPVAERTFSTAGQYLVRLQVTDRGGLTHVAERLLSVNPFRLGEFLATPNPVVAGAPVFFDALAFGENSFALRYDWDFTSDGTFDVLNQPGTQHSYGAVGTYQATMRGTDESEQSALVTRPITVIANAPPLAAFTATPLTTLAGLPVVFEATGSSDSDPDAGGGIATYAWTFGDGATGSGFFVEHTYAFPGIYPVQLTVTDTSGVSATTTQSVVITENHAPLASFTASPSPVVPGVPVMFDASASSDPDAAAGDAIVRYEWDLDGNGTFEVDGPTPAATRTYAATASYAITLRVTDRNGATDVQTETLDVVFGLINQTLRNALVGAAYQQQLAAGGASGPVAFSITSGPFTGSGPYDGAPGTACDGLRLTAMGRLAGTPTHVGLCGPFAVTATDGVASSANIYTVRVLPAVAYVANNGSSTVSVIDPATEAEVAVIPVPGQPGGVALRPDGERVYVTLPGSLIDLRTLHLTNPGSTVAVIDTGSQAVVATIPVGSVPTGIAASLDGRLMYVTNTLGQSISVIDTMTNTVVDTIVVNGLPVRLAVSPDGTRLYVADLLARIRVYNAASGVEQTAIGLPNSQVDAVALSPDGRYLLAGAANNSAVRVFDTTTMAEVTTLMAGPVSGIGLTPDGRLAYLAANPVGVVDLDGFVLNASVPTSGTPFEPAVTPDGRRALVTDFDSHVQLIDTADQTETGTIAVGDRPAGIAVVPNPSLHITSHILPAGQPGTAYAFPVVAAGGVRSYSFTADGNALPPGLTLGLDGLIAGVPAAAGNYRFFVTVTDADLPQQSITAEVSIRVGTLSTATISLANLSQVYDGTPRSVAVTTNPPNLHVVVTYDGSQVAPTGAGTYSVVAQLDELLYLADPVEGTLVVAKATQEITVDDPGPLAYGNPDFALSVFSTSGLTVSIAASGECTASGTLIHLTAAGTCTISATQAGDVNHEPAPAVQRSFTVAARAVTVTADAQTKFYGDTDLPLTYHITSGSLKAGDVFSGNLVRVAGENAGTYPILQGTLSLGSNYALSYVGADFTIAPRAVTVTADAQTKIYGHTDPPLTYRVTAGSLKAGDAFSGNLVRLAGENVGAYAIQQGTLSLGGNYTLTFIGANLTIDARLVTVTADPKTKIYGNADPPLTFNITGGSLKTGDAFSGNLVRVAGENVGTYPIQQGTLSLGGNYTLTFIGANLTIDARPVTVTADAKTKTYGNADPPLTFSITSGSLKTGDAFSGNLVRVAGENVGTYAIQQGTLSLGGNYTLTFMGANLTIDARPVTVTADTKTKFYGNADPPLTFSITSGSLKAGDAFSGNLVRLAGENVGTYAIQQGTLSLGSNYALSYVPSTLTIAPRVTTTVVSGPASVQYSDAITLSATVSASIYGPSPVTGSVEFFIGSRSYGTSPLAGAAASQTVTKSVVVIEPPGAYTVKAVFTSGNANYSSGQGTYALTVQSENAVPIAELGAYTGQIAAWTPTSSSNTATLTLAATIKDVSVDGGDPSPGDITTATVSFALRTSTGALTPIGGATNLPVGLVNPGVPGVGTAAKIVQFSLNANNVCDYYTVAVLIGGNYNMPTPAYQDTALTICRATPGSILAIPAAGLNAVGTAGFIAGNSTTNFDVKFNKSGTNPQGKARVTVRSPLNAITGTPDGKTHTYVITSNSIASLSVNGSKASFASKANLVEMVTNADGTVTAVTVDTAATFQLALTDSGAAGDTLAVTLNKSQGGLWFSSSWNGNLTIERPIQTGDIRVTP
jgi:YVTN family beta-propeller protein